jgi:diguanylate cyclase (GGDEF)-like protein/PAS domain S-box-containing protein
MPASTDSITVLLVEDSAADARLLQEMLMAGDTARFSLLHATTVEKAIQCAHSEEPDVVLLDMGLPDATGLEGVRRLRSSLPNVPLIVWTGLADEAAGISAVQHGAQDFLVKGNADRAAILRSISYAIQRHRADSGSAADSGRFSLALEAANDGLWDWNLITDEMYFSARWKAILGLGEEDIAPRSQSWFDRVHKDDVNRLRHEIDQHLHGQSPRLEVEHRMRHQDGSYRWVVSRGLAVRSAEGKALRLAGSQTDITAHRLTIERLRDDAFHDSLTGLPNRPLLLDRLGRAVKRLKRYDRYHFALLFLDIDRFKVVNDSLGHLVGDDLLIAIARRLTSCVRATDTVARLGGDEFAVLLEDLADVGVARSVAERILEQMRTPVEIEHKPVFVTASIGIVMGSHIYDRPEDVLRDSDTAMYRAKSEGKNRYEVFQKEMHDGALMRLELENDLRRAVERYEFRVAYQPIIDLQTGQISGFEALVRWYRPDCGVVLPADFIPVAEETGVIITVDRLVLHESCRQFRQWQQQLGYDTRLRLSVNFSPHQFRQADLVQVVDRILSETGFDPRDLNIEITESSYLEDPDSLVSVLGSLKSRGIRFYVDDFGVGYSSLGYLRRFPIDAVKIDRTFISRVDQEDGNSESGEIVRAVIALAKSLKIDIVAEGVEREQQKAFLKQLDCPLAQGYLFAKPLDPDSARDFLATHLNTAAQPA